MTSTLIPEAEAGVDEAPPGTTEGSTSVQHPPRHSDTGARRQRIARHSGRSRAGRRAHSGQPLKAVGTSLTLLVL